MRIEEKEKKKNAANGRAAFRPQHHMIKQTAGD